MKILYIFPSPKKDDYQLIVNGEAPTDRLYGVYELQQLGHKVEFNDDRFKGKFRNLIILTRNTLGINLYDLKTILACWYYDVVVVKNNFSLVLTLACKLTGTKVVYLDTLFRMPRKLFKKMNYWSNFQLLDRIVTYSDRQIDFWTGPYRIRRNKFQFLPYTIDVDFYRPNDNYVSSEPDAGDYVLSIGRDQGRDFDTLVEALDGLDINLKLITLPYRLSKKIKEKNYVQFYQNIPYDQLFHLYKNAKLVVIPLKEETIYPSGIRGLLESMALGKVSIVTYTPILEEYVENGKHVMFVDSTDINQLRKTIQELIADPVRCQKMGSCAQKLVRKQFNMASFADGFSNLLKTVVTQ